MWRASDSCSRCPVPKEKRRTLATPSDSASHILLVDDDRRIRELVASYLAGHGFRVTAAASADEARQRMRGLAFDLVVLDIMMKGQTGIEFAQVVRREANAVPILMLSALAQTEDRIKGLSAGGDDYLPKPFEPMELLLRIQSILRRHRRAPPAGNEVSFGRCKFNPARGELRRDGAIVKLTSRERDLLRTFTEHAGKAVARSDLMRPGGQENARTIDVQINRLRRKIETDPGTPVYLQTVHGEGYTLYVD
jgi:two-component system phosphate regulon response regulator OmpR